MVVLKEPFLGWQSNYKGRLKSSWTRLLTWSNKVSPYYSKLELCGGVVTVSFQNKVSP